MFEYLDKYIQGEYALTQGESHSKKCNAPKDSRGVYLVYHNFDLIYISSSGRIRKNDFEPKVRIADGGGLWAE